MMNPEISIQFFYHIIKNGSVILSNLPKELLPEVDTCLAESKLLSCKVRGVLKRQKKLPIEDGFVHMILLLLRMILRSISTFFYL